MPVAFDDRGEDRLRNGRADVEQLLNKHFKLVQAFW